MAAVESSDEEDFGDRFEDSPVMVKGGEDTDSDTEAQLEIPGIEQANFAGLTQVTRFKACFAEFFNNSWKMARDIDLDENTTRLQIIEVLMEFINPLFRDVYDYLIELRKNEWPKLLTESEWTMVCRYSISYMIYYMLATNVRGDYIQIGGKRYNMVTMYNIVIMKHGNLSDPDEKGVFDAMTTYQNLSVHKELNQPDVYYEFFKYIMASFCERPKGSLVSNWTKQTKKWPKFSYLQQVHETTKIWMRSNYRFLFDLLQLQITVRTVALRREATLTGESGGKRPEEIRFTPPLLSLLKADKNQGLLRGYSIIDPNMFIRHIVL